MKRKGARLGQHFLTAPWAARALGFAAQIQPGDKVLEIGPGKGALTKELLAMGATVIAIEKDELLAEKLQDTFVKEIENGALTVLEADVRDVKPRQFGLTGGSYILAANIPYYITGEIIRQFLTTEAQPKSMALLVQKEVAQRIVAKKSSILSLSVRAYGTPKLVEKVGRKNFSPPPEVDSAILAVTDISKKFFKGVSEEAFFTVVRAGFSSKRKFVRNNLSHIFGEDVSDVMRQCEINETARAEDMSLDEWKLLALELSKREKKFGGEE